MRQQMIWNRSPLAFGRRVIKPLQALMQPWFNPTVNPLLPSSRQPSKAGMSPKGKRSAALAKLVTVAAAKKPLGVEAPATAWTRAILTPGAPMYANRNDRLNIDFSVDRLGFPEIQTMDPRVVSIAPGKNNELHRHAHESLFVILEGRGEVRVGDRWSQVKKGDIAFVPRWAFHQTRNTSTIESLKLLAITDFGFTSAVLGDYDKRTRLSNGGADAKES